MPPEAGYERVPSPFANYIDECIEYPQQCINRTAKSDEMEGDNGDYSTLESYDIFGGDVFDFVLDDAVVYDCSKNEAGYSAKMRAAADGKALDCGICCTAQGADSIVACYYYEFQASYFGEKCDADFQEGEVLHEAFPERPEEIRTLSLEPSAQKYGSAEPNRSERDSEIDYIESEADYNEDTSMQEAALTQGREFSQIAREEDEHECCDHYLDQSDGSDTADYVKNVYEAQLVQGKIMDDIYDEEQQQECVDYFIDCAAEQSDEPTGAVYEVPLLYGRMLAALEPSDSTQYEAIKSKVGKEDEAHLNTECLYARLQDEESIYTLARNREIALQHNEEALDYQAAVVLPSIVSTLQMNDCIPEPHSRFERLMEHTEIRSQTENEVQSAALKPRFKFMNPYLYRYCKPIDDSYLDKMSPGRRRMFEILNRQSGFDGDPGPAYVQRKAAARLSNPPQIIKRIVAESRTSPVKQTTTSGRSSRLPRLDTNLRKCDYEYMQVGKLVRSIIAEPIELRKKVDSGVGGDL